MKRVVVLALAVCACGPLTGCGNSNTETASYDPQIDGLTPPSVSTPDLAILDDQRKLYDKGAPAPAAPAAVPAKAATPATSAPATAPVPPTAG